MIFTKTHVRMKSRLIKTKKIDVTLTQPQNT